MNRFDRSLRALLSIALVLTIGGATCGVRIAAAAVQNESPRRKSLVTSPTRSTRRDGLPLTAIPMRRANPRR